MILQVLLVGFLRVDERFHHVCRLLLLVSTYRPECSSLLLDDLQAYR